MTDYDKLRELAENATPGPWEMVLPTENEASVYNSTSDEPIAWEQDWHHAGVFARQDGEFIAAASPQAILNLLEDLRITRAERDAEKHKNLALRKGQGTYHQENK